MHELERLITLLEFEDLPQAAFQGMIEPANLFTALLEMTTQVEASDCKGLTADTPSKYSRIIDAQTIQACSKSLTIVIGTLVRPRLPYQYSG